MDGAGGTTWGGGDDTGRGSAGPCGGAREPPQSPRTWRGVAAHPCPLAGRTLGWALPLGRSIQPAPGKACLPSPAGQPHKIRAHGASLASRPGEQVWPVWGLIEDGHHGAAQRPLIGPFAAHYTEIPIWADREPPVASQKMQNSAGSSWVHPSEPRLPQPPWGQALISRGLCLPIRRTWMRMLRRP